MLWADGGKLKSSMLLSHIVDVMKGEYTCSAFGTDYSNVLLKNVLGVRHLWIDISQKTWHGELWVDVSEYNGLMQLHIVHDLGILGDDKYQYILTS